LSVRENYTDALKKYEELKDFIVSNPYSLDLEFLDEFQRLKLESTIADRLVRGQQMPRYELRPRNENVHTCAGISSSTDNQTTSKVAIRKDIHDMASKSTPAATNDDFAHSDEHARRNIRRKKSVVKNKVVHLLTELDSRIAAEEAEQSFDLPDETALDLAKKGLLASDDVLTTIRKLQAIRNGYRDYCEMFKLPPGVELKGFKTSKRNRTWYKQNLRPILRCYEECCQPTSNKTKLDVFIEKHSRAVDISRMSSEKQKKKYRDLHYIAGNESGTKHFINISAFICGCACNATSGCPCFK
jgi:hypothetical protein